MTTIIPVILSGGSGTRLWPMSTPAMPKQFLPLVGSHSMFYQTLVRVADRTIFAAPVIVCGAGHVALVQTDLCKAGISDAVIIVEPAARNTAPAIALAALSAPVADALMLVMPSDHVISDVATFLNGVATASPVARNGALATFGIRPTMAETGYGYIALGAPISGHHNVHQVTRFVEKPTLAVAQQMLSDGGYVWNAGIFLMRADCYLEELSNHAPRMLECCKAAIAKAQRNQSIIYPDAAGFADCPADSIDCAVMEKARQVVVTPIDPGWSDVGSWSALWDLADKDSQGNALTGDVTTIDVDACLVRVEGGKRVAMLGVSGLIVVAHGDDILIISRDRAQDVKQIIP